MAVIEDIAALEEACVPFPFYRDALGRTSPADRQVSVKLGPKIERIESKNIDPIAACFECILCEQTYHPICYSFGTLVPSPISGNQRINLQHRRRTKWVSKTEILQMTYLLSDERFLTRFQQGSPFEKRLYVGPPLKDRLRGQQLSYRHFSCGLLHSIAFEGKLAKCIVRLLNLLNNAPRQNLKIVDPV